MLFGGIVVLQCLGYGIYVVESGSMEPTIPVGGIVIADRNYPYGNIKVNDVIVYRKGDIMVTHRVVRKVSEGLETKGDANRAADGLSVTSENFEGKIVESIPKIGYLYRWACGRWGKAAIVIWIAAANILNICVEVCQKENAGYVE